MSQTEEIKETKQDFKEFLNYNFDLNEKFRTYIDGIFPEPKGLLLKKFQRKFYKKEIDPNFNIEFDNISKKVFKFI